MCAKDQNTVWSELIQGKETLYRSRSIRFCDLFKDRYKAAFDIDGKHRILEIGCGPGALAESLSRWYGNAEICAIDRDSAFIAYASEKAPHIRFSLCDICAMPFEGESFDVTISNTVAEHIAPESFYKEQFRILTNGGVCLVLSSRKGLCVTADCIAYETEFERELWSRSERFHKELFAKHGVCAYPQNEADIPLNMEKYGFHDVRTDYIIVDLTPDDPKYDRETALRMIDAERYNDIENARALPKTAPGVVSHDEAAELERLIDLKYDRRKELYDKGEKQWDTNVSVIMITRGIKK